MIQNILLDFQFLFSSNLLSWPTKEVTIIISKIHSFFLIFDNLIRYFSWNSSIRILSNANDFILRTNLLFECAKDELTKIMWCLIDKKCKKIVVKFERKSGHDYCLFTPKIMFFDSQAKQSFNSSWWSLTCMIFYEILYK